MWAIPVALLAATSVTAVNYHGQLYNTDIAAPGPDSPWYTGGYNQINATTIQTLICCPPLPPVSWVLRNNNTGLLAQELTLSSNQVGDFTGPTNPPIPSAQAGSGYVLCSVLTEDPSQVFGCSGQFEILDGTISPPIVTDGPEVTGGTSVSASASTSAPVSATDQPSTVGSSGGGASVSATAPGASETTEPASPLAPSQSQTKEQSQTASSSRSAAANSAGASNSSASSGASPSPSTSNPSSADRTGAGVGLAAAAAAAAALALL